MFETIIGNDRNKEVLQKAISNQKVSHSYLFIGIEGIGKKEFAKEFAKRILCQEENYQGNCKSCIEFDSKNHPDFFILKPEGNSLKIEQIREMQKKVAEKPIISNHKVYIIDDSDKMTTEAQNCLLKTLEEPPEFVTIILVGSHETSFLSTIKSRCMILHFDPIENELLTKYLKEQKISICSDSMLEIFQGSIGKAITLKESQELYKQVENFAKQLEKKSKIDLVNFANVFYQNKEEIFGLLDYLNILLLKLAKNNFLYTNGIQIVENTKRRLQSNSNYDMCMDYLVFSLVEAIKGK